MAIPTGAAAYKKKDGVLTLTPDRKNVIWTPNSAPGGPPVVSLVIANITSEPLTCIVDQSRMLTTIPSRSPANPRYCCQGYAEDI